ncbi:hypothetical protein ANCCEY_13928 [Ancylostoma ceylanicum]|uniref:Uncharacterized protein n=1 Tax=Ancylostoma ceylanicum TaxID=53326 RepID=A0A0D6L7P5_9BILA|nr:hypothetical protein ANCCEY_13928 [Ancylostoma ceylanicum]
MNGVDATKIIGPFMSPFMDMFDVMQGNAKARAYADKKIEKLFFPRQKREVHRRKKREPSLQPLPNPDLFNPFRELEKPILELSNPFKPNPLMSLFTTPLPLSELPAIEKPKLLDMPIPTPTLPAPQYKLQDPFYNPLYPNRKSKIFDVLAGGEAVRLLG